MRAPIIFILAFLFIGCSDWHGGDRYLDEETFDSNALAMVQQDSGIQLPPGSRGLNMFYQGSKIDPAFVAKILIPSSGRDELIAHIEKIPNQDSNVNGSLAEKVTWWNPKNGKVRIERRSSPNGNYLRAILSQEKEQLVLYIEWIKI